MTQPLKNEVYKHLYTGIHWTVIDFYHHDPKTCAPRDYILIQVYGNYYYEMDIVPVDAWDHLFLLAWEPLKECKFCGFYRMHPCTKKQVCPNLMR